MLNKIKHTLCVTQGTPLEKYLKVQIQEDKNVTSRGNFQLVVNVDC